MGSKTWSVLAGIALLMALLLLIFGGYLPGQEYFKVSRIDLFDANGVLIDSIKLPGGSFLEWEDTTQFSRMDIYAEWRFVLTDPDPDPPARLRMVLEVLGEFTDLPAGMWMPPPDSGTGPYGLSLWDHELSWVSTGTSAGDPDKNDYECKSASGGIMFATIYADAVEARMNPNPGDPFLLKVKRTLGPTTEESGYVPVSMEFWEGNLGYVFVVADPVGSVFSIDSWNAWGTSDSGTMFPIQ